MKNQTQAMKLGLGALALGVCMASGNTVISIDGTPNADYILDSGQMIGVTWSQTDPYFDVAITVRAQGWDLGGTGTAYLTRSIGAGTTEADQVALTQFSFPSANSPVSLFNGLNLQPGTYYLTLTADPGADGLWEGVFAGTAVVTAAPGVTLLPDYYSGSLSPYPPSSPVFPIDPPEYRPVFIVTGALVPPTNHPPIARCKAIEVVADQACTATITPADMDDGSYDPDGDPVSFALIPAGPFGLGSNFVTLIVTDSQDQSSSCSSILTVVDRTAPTIRGGSASPSILWPPNHKMVDVVVDYETWDACGAVRNELQVVCNENPDTLGAGNASPDIEIIDAHHVRLRAERSGGGNGRIYTINTTCTDASGNVAQKSVIVTVPHSQDGKRISLRKS